MSRGVTYTSYHVMTGEKGLHSRLIPFFRFVPEFLITTNLSIIRTKYYEQIATVIIQRLIIFFVLQKGLLILRTIFVAPL